METTTGDSDDGSGSGGGSDLLTDDEEAFFSQQPGRILDHGQPELFSAKVKGLTPCQKNR